MCKTNCHYAVLPSMRREYLTWGEEGKRQTGWHRAGYDIFEILGDSQGTTTVWLRLGPVGWVREHEDIDAFLAAALAARGQGHVL